MCKDEGDIQGQRIDVSTQRKETPLDLLPTVSSLNPGQFFFFFLLSLVELLNEPTRRRWKTDGQEKSALSEKKNMKMLPVIVFQFISPRCAPDSSTFFHQNILLSKTTILSLCHGVVK